MSTDIELEPYKEVIDIMAKRIKKTEHINSELQGVIITYQQRVESLEAALFAIKDSPAYSPNALRAMAADALSNDLQNHNS